MIYAIKQIAKYVYWGWKLIIGLPIVYDTIMIIYLICAMAIGIGDIVVNGILLGITTLILIVSIILNDKELKKRFKKRKIVKIHTVRKTKHVLNIAKIIVKTYTLGLTLYGLYMAISIVSPIAIISTIISILLWFFSIIVEIATALLDSVRDMLENDKELFASLYEKGKGFVSEKYAEGKEYTQEKLTQGKEYVQEKYEQGKGFAQEKYEQGKEYAQGVVEQGKTKLDETKTAVQDFFKKSKKAE